MKNITNKMINEFSKIYLSETPFVIEKVDSNITKSFEVIIKHGYIKSNTQLVLSERFYEILNYFFEEQGIELSFNNTGTIFWANQSNLTE